MPIQRLPTRALSGAITTANLPPQISINSSASAGALTIDANSRITMPSQPAFGATNSNNTQQSGDIVLNTAGTNIGGHYSTTTGRFTAPINGNYHFTFITVAGSDTNFRINFRKNGVTVTPYGYIASDNNDTGGVATVMSLVAGDYVSAFTVNTIEPEYSSFCGFLLG